MARRDRSPTPLFDLLRDFAVVRPPPEHPAAGPARAAARRRKTSGKASRLPSDAFPADRPTSRSSSRDATRTTTNGTIDPATWSPAMDDAARAANARLAELAAELATPPSRRAAKGESP